MEGIDYCVWCQYNIAEEKPTRIQLAMAEYIGVIGVEVFRFKCNCSKSNGFPNAYRLRKIRGNGQRLAAILAVGERSFTTDVQ